MHQKKYISYILITSHIPNLQYEGHDKYAMYAAYFHLAITDIS